MRARYHRFLLALLILVLPLQGFAFVSMLDRALAPQPATVGQMETDGGMVGGCHDHGEPDTPAPQHDCQHCAACVLGAALPVPARAALTVLPISRSFATPPDTPYNGFVPDGPERPPRPSFA